VRDPTARRELPFRRADVAEQIEFIYESLVLRHVHQNGSPSVMLREKNGPPTAADFPDYRGDVGAEIGT
jgi:hypothetical protein